MYNNNKNANELAAIFKKAYMSTSEIVKKAQSDNGADQEGQLDSEQHSGVGSAPNVASEYEAQAADLLSISGGSEDLSSNAEDSLRKRIENNEKKLASRKIYSDNRPIKQTSFLNKKTERILNGLGKVAGSLKSKGNFFAADVVEVTAKKIHLDAVKSAESKMKVVGELRKIAKSLEKNNDIISSDVVKVTINKIINS